MNIFALNTDPTIAATMHVDSHVVKMRLETCQLMVSTIHASHGVTKRKHITPVYVAGVFKDFPRKHEDGTPFPYGIGYMNHPCRKWISESSKNWDWLYCLGQSLCLEHAHRFKLPIEKQKCCHILKWCNDNKPKLPDRGLTNFALAIEERLKHPPPTNIFECTHRYLAYYIQCKRHLFKWTNREVPMIFE